MEAVSKRIFALKSISDMLKSSKENSLPKNKVYGVINNYEKKFFDTRKEMKEYLKENNLKAKDSFKVEYVGNCLERDNVIRYTKANESFLYEIIDDSTYFKFGSTNGRSYRWQFKYGNITDYYKALDRYDVKKLVR